MSMDSARSSTNCLPAIRRLRRNYLWDDQVIARHWAETTTPFWRRRKTRVAYRCQNQFRVTIFDPSRKKE